MKKTGSVLLLSLSLLCSDCRSQPNQIDRQPAVAGQFYPSQPAELTSMLKKLFASAVPPKNPADLVAVISPHAGYVFSGGVAASAFRQIDPARRYDNVFILGPSHQMAIEKACVYASGDFITPLGRVKVNRELGARLARDHSVFTTETEAHLYEHSVEVQIPFLQYWLQKDFQIVPIVVAARSPETCRQIAEALRPYLTKSNLFIISSDFSHYPAYGDAVKVDSISADAVLSNSPSHLIEVTRSYEEKGIPNLLTTMCGWSCILTLLYMTERAPGVSFSRIEYKNSGDSEVGDKVRVVGYNAIAVYLKDKKESSNQELNKNDKKLLLALARNTIVHYLHNKQILPIDILQLSAAVKTNGGTFVTLRKHGDLRGCIGRFDAVEPLYLTVQQMAIASATEDYRFPQVSAEEVDGLEIEISALTPMRKISSIDEIQLGRDGIYLRKGNRSGTFLPQVATETGWTKEEFLGHCAQDKAGLSWDGWKDAEIYVYEANVFSEQDLGR